MRALGSHRGQSRRDHGTHRHNSHSQEHVQPHFSRVLGNLSDWVFSSKCHAVASSALVSPPCPNGRRQQSQRLSANSLIWNTNSVLFHASHVSMVK